MEKHYVNIEVTHLMPDNIFNKRHETNQQTKQLARGVTCVYLSFWTALSLLHKDVATDKI